MEPPLELSLSRRANRFLRRRFPHDPVRLAGLTWQLFWLGLRGSRRVFEGMVFESAEYPRKSADQIDL